MTDLLLGDPAAISTSGSQPINCNITAAPTKTGAPVLCWVAQSTALSASLITIGVTVLPYGIMTWLASS